MKKYNILVLAMSTLPDPLVKNQYTGNTAFDNCYVFSGSDMENQKIYHGIGQLEPVPQYILDRYGALTHCIILQTPEVQESKPFDWEQINQKIIAEGDKATIDYVAGEPISAMRFFEKRMEAFYRQRENADRTDCADFKQKPKFVPIDISEDAPEKGLEDLLKAISTLYVECLTENEDKVDKKVWQLFVDVHGGYRAASLAMFALIQSLSAPDEQDLISGRDNAGIARLTDGKGTIPIKHVYTVNFDFSKKNPEEDPHTIVDKTEFYQIFTKASLEAYMNYGQYAKIALKPTINLKEYKGEPYAFISYRRMDAPKERFAFLGVLKKEGFRYWYDDSIELQTDWKKTLKTAVKNSSVFIALITKNYYDSFQCLKELRQALDENKTILFVSLDRTDLYSPECDITKELKENILNENGEVIGEKTVDTVTVYKNELEIIGEKQHLSLKDFLIDGVFQPSSLKDKLINDLCKNNEAFRALMPNDAD